MAAGRLHLWRPRGMTTLMEARPPHRPQGLVADTRGIGPLWALLAEIGRSEGNSTRFSQIQGEVYKTDTKTLL